MNEQQDESPPAETVTDPITMYFPVSCLKLATMSVCTLGFYEIFWYYAHWCVIKEREESNISPIWRAVFAFIFCYPLFRRIRMTAKSQGLHKSLAAGPLAILWVIFTLLGGLPAPFLLITFLSVLFLVPIQKTVNEINTISDPGHDPNSTFTVWNKVAVVIGGLIWVLGLMGIFLRYK